MMVLFSIIKVFSELSITNIGVKMIGLSKRQNEIIEASVSLISQLGIQSFTMRKLAEKLTVSEPALYRHYKNKSEILNIILELFKQESNKALSDIDATNNTSIDKLQLIFLSRCVFFWDNPDYSSIIFSEELFRNDSDLSQKLKSLMKFHQEKLLEITSNGQNKNEIRSDIPAEHITVMFLGTLRLLVTKWRMSEYKFNLPKIGLEYFESIKKLLIAEKE